MNYQIEVLKAFVASMYRNLDKVKKGSLKFEFPTHCPSDDSGFSCLMLLQYTAVGHLYTLGQSHQSRKVLFCVYANNSFYAISSYKAKVNPDNIRVFLVWSRIADEV